LAATVDLPTPPLPLAMAMTLLTPSMGDEEGTLPAAAGFGAAGFGAGAGSTSPLASFLMASGDINLILTSRTPSTASTVS